MHLRDTPPTSQKIGLFVSCKDNKIGLALHKLFYNDIKIREKENPIGSIQQENLTANKGGKMQNLSLNLLGKNVMTQAHKQDSTHEIIRKKGK